MNAEASKGKRLAVNMAAQIVSFAVNVAISFFLTPFIVAKLGRETYGFVGLANNFISYAQILVTALNSMAARFITISIHREQFDTANQYFSSLVIANAIIAAVLTVPAVLVVAFLDKLLDVPAGIVTDVQLLWSLLFFEALVGVVTSVFGSATYVKNRLDLSSRRSIESDLLRAGLVLAAFVFLRPHVYYLGVAAVICVTYRTAANVHYTRMLLPEVRISRKYFRWDRLRELLASGVWNSVTRISEILSNELDLLLTNLMVSASAMGVVSIAKNLPALILAAFGMLAGVFMPQLNISYARSDTAGMRAELLFAVKLLGMFACIPVACLLAFGRSFFALWVPGEDAALLAGLCAVSILSYPLSLPLEPLWNIFTVTNKIKQSSLFLIMNAVVSLSAVFALLGVAATDEQKMYVIVGVSCAVGLIRSATFLPLYGAKCLGLGPGTFYGPICKNLLSLAVTTAIAFALRQFIPADTWPALILACALTACAALAVNYFVMLRREERAMFADKIRARVNRR